ASPASRSSPSRPRRRRRPCASGAPSAATATAAASARASAGAAVAGTAAGAAAATAAAGTEAPVSPDTKGAPAAPAAAGAPSLPAPAREKGGRPAERGEDVAGKPGAAAARNGGTVVQHGETAVQAGEIVVQGGETIMQPGEIIVQHGETLVQHGEIVVQHCTEISGLPNPFPMPPGPFPTRPERYPGRTRSGPWLLSAEPSSRWRMRFLALLAFLLAVPALAQSHPPGAAFDVLHYRFALALSDGTDEIGGEATIEVAILEEGTDAIALDLVGGRPDGKGMFVTAVEENRRPLAFRHEDDRLVITLPEPAAAGEVHTLTVAYEGIPADGLIIATNKHGDRTFFGDNWPERARHWLPSVDHPSDKATVEWVVTAPAHYQVVGSGRLVEETDLGEGRRLTRWRSEKPLATKIMVIGAARFAVEHPASGNGVPV